MNKELKTKKNKKYFDNINNGNIIRFVFILSMKIYRNHKFWILRNNSFFVAEEIHEWMLFKGRSLVTTSITTMRIWVLIIKCNNKKNRTKGISKLSINNESLKEFKIIKNNMYFAVMDNSYL